MTINLTQLGKKMDSINITSNFGYITRVVGLIIESEGPQVSIGELCLVEGTAERIKAEVVGFDGNKVLLMPIGDMKGIKAGARVLATGKKLTVKVGSGLVGNVVDGLGQSLNDDNFIMKNVTEMPVMASPPPALKRKRIKKPLSLGIRAIDGVLTCGRGQRLGIFAGSGVGKSVLLGMVARNTEADINVIGLIGERGREVRDFVERDLGEAGLARSIVVVATSDKPALVRFKAAQVTTAIAEYFRNQGQNVLLMMDSVTRVAMALREVGLAVGEPPATRGYPPSVFAELPRLLERTGSNHRGTITALYTVLVEGDDFNEPVADTVRGILDGHLSLTRQLAARNHYPAIDIMESVSRVMPEITSEKHQEAAGEMKKLVANYREAEDLINIGAYEKGSNPDIDKAITKIKEINAFLQQKIKQKAAYEETINHLQEIVS